MKNVHAIIQAYHGYAEMGALQAERTGASMPFAGRYRLIDFALSSLMNAGIHNVAVIMQRGYQSLLDHVGSGRSWDMARHVGGLTLLPPFGLPTATKGTYDGNVEALEAAHEYIEAIGEEYVIVMRGDLCASIDLEKVVQHHIDSGVDVTSVCTPRTLPYTHHTFIMGEDNIAKQMLCMVDGNHEGISQLEVYVMKTSLLLELIEYCYQRGLQHFNRDALTHLMATGGKIGVYLHEGYACHIVDVPAYYQANMDMLDPVKRSELFPEDRHVLTPGYIDVSTFYGDHSSTVNSLIADGCIIEGTVENSILFSGVHVGPGCSIKNCIILDHTDIGEGAKLHYVIADKKITVSPGAAITGNENLPIVIPKGKKI